MLSGLLLFSGCAGYDGGGVAYYDYDYYPDYDVYYYPEGRMYYWNEGGEWRSGERLPDRYDMHERHSERLRLHSQQPWTEHHEHGAPDRHSGPYEQNQMH